MKRMVKSSKAAARGNGAESDVAGPEQDPTAWRHSELACLRTIELVFFAHLQMADPADRILAAHGLGRPHHRVLYFARHKPGISVGELTGLLRITNQALSRSTNQLVLLGLIEQRYGREDRRVRQHFVTPKGASLLTELTRPQMAMVRAAHKQLLGSQVEGLWRGLEAMARPQDKAWLSPHPLSTQAD